MLGVKLVLFPQCISFYTQLLLPIDLLTIYHIYIYCIFIYSKWSPHLFPVSHQMVSPWFPRGLQDFVLLHLWRRLPRKLPAVASFHEAMAPQLLGVDQLTEDARGPGQATAYGVYGTARRGVFEWCFWGKMGGEIWGRYRNLKYV